MGEVVSNRMHKTIVVEVVRKRAHPFYGRVISKHKKFYAHDEKNEAHTGDLVRLEETRPLSKLKRWRLKEVVRRAGWRRKRPQPRPRSRRCKGDKIMAVMMR